MVNKLSIHCDGGSRGNPGPAAFAFVVSSKDKILFKKSQYIGEATNNVAEYKGVREAMRWLEVNKNKIKKYKIDFYLDSQLVVRQMTGEYKIKNQNLIPLASEIKKIQRELSTDVHFNFVRRDKNKLADKLLNQKLDEVKKNS